VSSGKHRRREGSDDEASPRDDERSDLFQDHADASASSNWLGDTSMQAKSSSGGIFGFMSGGGAGAEPGRTDERGVGEVRQNSRNWLSMPIEYTHDAGQFALGAPEHHASPNNNALERASTRGEGGANGFNGNDSQRARGGAGADRPDGASPRGDAVSPRAQDTSSSPLLAQASISRRIFSDGSDGDEDGRSARDRQPGGGWERESGALHQVEPGSSTSPRARDEGGSPQTGARAAKALVPKLNLASAGLAGGAGGLSPRSPRGAGDRSAGGTRAYG
jgi:hypothetical protein